MKPTIKGGSFSILISSSNLDARFFNWFTSFSKNNFSVTNSWDLLVNSLMIFLNSITFGCSELLPLSSTPESAPINLGLYRNVLTLPTGRYDER